MKASFAVSIEITPHLHLSQWHEKFSVYHGDDREHWLFFTCLLPARKQLACSPQYNRENGRMVPNGVRRQAPVLGAQKPALNTLLFFTAFPKEQ
jgi:hypothetical protein